MDSSEQPGGGPSWDDKAEWKRQVWSKWMEPTVIIIILLSAMYLTRRKNYSIFRWKSDETTTSLLHRAPSPSDWDPSTESSIMYPPKTRRILGRWVVHTPNSSRFADHFHSRILQKFPFLVEMFYWAIALVLYRGTILITGHWYGGSQGLWDIAQHHGTSILELESKIDGLSSIPGPSRWLEWRIQHFFLDGAAAGDWRGGAIAFLNRAYALLHIPGTVAFIAYYYATAPTHRRFCTVRRGFSLANFVAFIVFTLYPCMPPRLLPGEYGFVDTVEAEDATSVWMKGDYVNALAAMPSMHFGYAFAIGCVLVFESGFLRHLDLAATVDEEEGGILKHELRDAPRSMISRLTLLLVGIFYPALILLAIIATANHYFLDVIAGASVVGFSFLCNRFLLNFLVFEDWLLWAWRLEKPEPTTGYGNNE
ncbi:PAP2 superfamily-domain-containing protein [Xylariaceae sp. FL0255]|nr:PAP2 superfamily-domain-containing protein [Xylariaceae sp. FL0255]